MGTCPDSIKRLIERFTQQSDQVCSPDYNETLLRIDFINPLMRELGWDIDNTQSFAEQYREVVHEDRVRVAGQTKAPDYSFRVGGQRKFFLEAKRPAIDIKSNWEPAYQLRRYAWSAKLAVSLLTDFEELAVYDTRIPPKQFDKPAVARREYIRYTDYPDRWEFLAGTFSKRAVYEGEFDRYCESKKGRGALPFDDAFLGEIEEWRKAIASNLALRNDALDEAGLNFAVQRIIDRLIFLRIAEDRGTEGVGQLQGLLNGDHIYQRLVTVFNRADERYNSGLFHFHRERDRDEAPDTLTPTLAVDDRTLKQIISALYYPESPYEFTMVSADILGSIYERFLGRVITLTPAHRAKIQDKPEVRKAGGVYYTPTYIVDYIVKNTVGALLGTVTFSASTGATTDQGAPAEKVTVPLAGQTVPLAGQTGTGTFSAMAAFASPRRSGAEKVPVPRLKILDPACGSGSFLIGAYQYLLDWYLAQYITSDPGVLATGKNPVLRPGIDGAWKLTISERKRILLAHIHGVDIDAQAVEVTKLNLLLKCLEGETSQTLGFEQRLFRERALPDLGKNILCGNSLIGTDIIGTEAWNQMSEEERRRINPFDYERAFPAVFKGKGGGFDAVIGNPPYRREQNYKELLDQIGAAPWGAKYRVARMDLWYFFIHRSLEAVGSGGIISFIVNSYWTASTGATLLIEALRDQTDVQEIVSLGKLKVFDKVGGQHMVIRLQKSQKKSSTRIRLVPPDTQEKTAERYVVGREPLLEFDKAHGELFRRDKVDLQPSAEALFRKFEASSSLSALGELRQGIVANPPAVSRRSHVAFGQRWAVGEGVFTLLPHELARLNVPAVEMQIVRGYYDLCDLGRYYISEEPSRAIIYGSRETWEREDAFPTLRAHLARFRAIMEERRETQQGKVPWYHLHWPRVMAVWEAPKIICVRMAERPAFVATLSAAYVPYTAIAFSPNATCPVDLHFICAILNSRLMWKWFIHHAKRRGIGLEINNDVLELAPIRIPNAANLDEKRIGDRLATLAATMLSLHKRLAAEKLPQRREQIQREIDATDRQIDALVYQLYGLTDEEIAIVESATAPVAKASSGNKDQS